jgi:hypothetical protein
VHRLGKGKKNILSHWGTTTARQRKRYACTTCHKKEDT